MDILLHATEIPQNPLNNLSYGYSRSWIDVMDERVLPAPGNVNNAHYS